MGCDFPEHHGRSSGVDWWLVLVVAAVAAAGGALWLVWEALGSPVAVSTAVAGVVLVGVLVGVVGAVVGAVRATSGRRGGEVPVVQGRSGHVPVRVRPTEPPVPAVDELAARRQRRVA